MVTLFQLVPFPFLFQNDLNFDSNWHHYFSSLQLFRTLENLQKMGGRSEALKNHPFMLPRIKREREI